jgi:hypothetical protein
MMRRTSSSPSPLGSGQVWTTKTVMLPIAPTVCHRSPSGCGQPRETVAEAFATNFYDDDENPTKLHVASAAVTFDATFETVYPVSDADAKVSASGKAHDKRAFLDIQTPATIAAQTVQAKVP